MRALQQVTRWLLALVILGAATATGLLLGVGLDRLAWETGFTDGDSGMELVAYLGLGALVGLSAGVGVAGVFLRRTSKRTDPTGSSATL